MTSTSHLSSRASIQTMHSEEASSLLRARPWQAFRISRYRYDVLSISVVCAHWFIFAGQVAGTMLPLSPADYVIDRRWDPLSNQYRCALGMFLMPAPYRIWYLGALQDLGHLLISYAG